VRPDVHAQPYPKIIKLDLQRRVALFAPGIEIPLVPFLGIMTVMPPDPLANTRPPGIYGGNMDFNRLTVGASLYLRCIKPAHCFTPAIRMRSRAMAKSTARRSSLRLPQCCNLSCIRASADR
jgi:hypothetical protein